MKRKIVLDTQSLDTVREVINHLFEGRERNIYRGYGMADLDFTRITVEIDITNEEEAMLRLSV